MKWIFQNGIISEKDLEQISLLDKMTYSEKYLLSIDEYKERLNKNPNQLYIIKNSKRDIVAYVSIIPLTYDAYIRIKNGETDRDVITVNSIIAANDKKEYYYWDSIIVDPKYRRMKLGKRIANFALKDIIKNNPDIKGIMAHAISKGGINITKKYGLEIKKNLDKTTVVVERVFNKKSYVRSRTYKDRDKKLQLHKKIKVIDYGLV